MLSSAAYGPPEAIDARIKLGCLMRQTSGPRYRSVGQLRLVRMSTMARHRTGGGSVLHYGDLRYPPNLPIHCTSLIVLLLAACGGGGGGTMDASGGAAPPRGTLLQSPPELISTLTAPICCSN